MNIAREFKHFLEELTVYQRNLNKDNIVRRKDIIVTNRKFRKLDKFKNSYEDLKTLYNKSEVDVKGREEIKCYASAINKHLQSIESVLSERLQLSRTEQAEGDDKVGQIPIVSDSSASECSDIEVKMSDKFDLKTASSLLPVMNGSETVTKQLIDAIELYNSMLDDAGKSLLTTYILKKCLNESAKIRLNKSYSSNGELVKDLRNHFVTKKSISHLSTQLNDAKQGQKSIDQFGKSIEGLLTDLTIAQSEGDEKAMEILGKVNERIAINSFANGLRNNDLRTIVKARNYSKLADAIQGAKDEEIPSMNNGQVFHTRGNKNFRRGSANNRVWRGNNNSYNSSRNQVRGINYNSNYRGHNNNNRNAFSNRARGSNFGNNTRKAYYMSNSGEQSFNNVNNDLHENFQSTPPSGPFFRDPTGNL